MVAKERVLLTKGGVNSEEPKKAGSDGKGGGKDGLKKIPLYLIPLAIFGLVWVILSGYNVFFFWKALSAAIVATASVGLIKSVLDLKEAKTGGSIGLVWCLFFLILIGHYAVPKENLSAEKPKEKNGIVRQAGVLENVDDVWVVDNIFYNGDELDIEVTGGSVEMVSGRVFAPGKHQETVTGNGSIGFKALTNEPTKIRVWFRK